MRVGEDALALKMRISWFYCTSELSVATAKLSGDELEKETATTSL